MKNVTLALFTIITLLLCVQLVNATALGGAVLLSQDDAKEMFGADALIDCPASNKVITTPCKQGPVTIAQSIKEKTILQFIRGNFKVAIYVPGSKEPLTTGIVDSNYVQVIDDKLVDSFISTMRRVNFNIDQTRIDKMQQLPIKNKYNLQNDKATSQYLKRFASERMILWTWVTGVVPDALEMQKGLYEYYQSIDELTVKDRAINDADVSKIFGMHLSLKPAQKTTSDLGNSQTQEMTTQTEPNGYLSDIYLATQVDDLQLELDDTFKEYYNDHNEPGDMTPTGTIDTSESGGQGIYALQQVQKLKEAKGRLVTLLEFIEKHPDEKIDKQELKENLISFSNSLHEARTYKIYDLLTQTSKQSFTRKDNGFEQAKLNLLNYYLTSPEVLLELRINKKLSETFDSNTQLDSTDSNKKKNQIQELKDQIIFQNLIIKDPRSTTEETSRAIERVKELTVQIVKINSDYSAPKRTPLTPKQQTRLDELTKDYAAQQAILKDYTTPNDGRPISKEIQEAGIKLAIDYNEITEIMTSTYLPEDRARKVITPFEGTTEYQTLLQSYENGNFPDYFIVIYPSKYAVKKVTMETELNSVSSTSNHPLGVTVPTVQIISDYSKKSDTLLALKDGFVKPGKYTIADGQAFVVPQGHYSELNFKDLFFGIGYSNTGFKVLQAVYYDQFQLSQKDDLLGQTNVFVSPQGKGASVYQLPVQLLFQENAISTFKEDRKTQLTQNKAFLEKYLINLTDGKELQIKLQGEAAFQNAVNAIIKKYSSQISLTTAEIRRVANFSGKNARREKVREVAMDYDREIADVTAQLQQVNAQYDQESSQTTDLPVATFQLPIPNYATKELENAFTIKVDKLEMIAGNAEFKPTTINLIASPLTGNTYLTRSSALVDYSKSGDYKVNVEYKKTPLSFQTLNRFIRVEGDGIFQIYTPNNDIARLYGADTENRNLMIYSLGNKKMKPASALYLTSNPGTVLEASDLNTLVKISDVSYEAKRVIFTLFGLDKASGTYSMLPQTHPNGISFETKQISDNFELIAHETNNNGILVEVKSLNGGINVGQCRVVENCENKKQSITFHLPFNYDGLLLQQYERGASIAISGLAPQPIPINPNACTNNKYFAINLANQQDPIPLECNVEKIQTLRSEIFLPKVPGTSCTNEGVKAGIANLQDIAADNPIIDLMKIRGEYGIRETIDYFLTVVSLDPLLLQKPAKDVDAMIPRLQLVLAKGDDQHTLQVVQKDTNGRLVFSKISDDWNKLPTQEYVLYLYDGNTLIETFGTCNDRPVTAYFVRPEQTFETIEVNQGDLTEKEKVSGEKDETPNYGEFTADIAQISQPNNGEKSEEVVNVKIDEKQKASLDESATDAQKCLARINTIMAPNLLSRISANIKFTPGVTHVYVYNTQEQVIATLKPAASKDTLQLVGPSYSSELTSKEFLIVQFKDENENTLYTACGYGPLPVKR